MCAAANSKKTRKKMGISKKDAKEFCQSGVKKKGKK